MTLPNFLIIGAAKSGTSALYHYLRQHPQIFMSPRKETHFFGYDGIDPRTNGPGDTIVNAVIELPDYLSLFQDVQDEVAVGEASPTYLYVPRAVDRIKHYIPDVKMVAILRNPADRAFSAYMHLRRDEREYLADFDEALAAEDKRIKENWGPIWHYKAGSMYSEQIERYLNTFPREQLRVYIYEEFKQDPITVLRNIFDFIGVDITFTPDIAIKPNVSGKPKSIFIQRLIQFFFLKPNPFRFLARRLISRDARWRFTTIVRNVNLQRVRIPLHTKKRLMAYFSDDIRKLEELLERDLSIWRTGL